VTLVVAYTSRFVSHLCHFFLHSHYVATIRSLERSLQLSKDKALARHCKCTFGMQGRMPVGERRRTLPLLVRNNEKKRKKSLSPASTEIILTSPKLPHALANEMERPAKAHRAPQSGRGAEKKAVAKDKDGNKPEKKKGFNEKVGERLASSTHDFTQIRWGDQHSDYEPFPGLPNP
jgi:hypothetical protein